MEDQSTGRTRESMRMAPLRHFHRPTPWTLRRVDEDAVLRCEDRRGPSPLDRRKTADALTGPDRIGFGSMHWAPHRLIHSPP